MAGYEAATMVLGIDQGEGGEPPAPRDRILDAASLLFYRRGIRAVGVDLVISEARVAKATFYRHYPSKDDLVRAYIDRAHAAVLNWVQREVESRATGPRERLLAIFDALAVLFALPMYRGCAVRNAVAEVQDSIPDVVERAREGAGQLHAYVEGLAKDAAVDDPTALADMWTLLIDGAFVASAREGGVEPAYVARRVAEGMLAG
jgi:AcrR family transcriptional regulator